MIELICRSVNIGAACNVGGPPEISLKKFLINHTELEDWLMDRGDKYDHREVIGVIIPEKVM